MQVALRAIVGSIAHDDSLVSEVREAFEELEHGHAGSVTNSILLQVHSRSPFQTSVHSLVAAVVGSAPTHFGHQMKVLMLAILCTAGHERTVAYSPLPLNTCVYRLPGTVNQPSA